jgi:uncharacterized protein
VDFHQAKLYALQRLERDLSPNLVYHGIGHTRDDVVPAVERLADMEKINGESLSLLLTSAWFHDLGYAEQRQYHELISARIAVKTLPNFGYTEEQVEVVRWAILATALPQDPRNVLEQILTDADLDVLGREDLISRNDDLRRELVFFGQEFTDLEWVKSQIRFLETHTYFTASAHALRDAGKSENLRILKESLEAFGESPT